MMNRAVFETAFPYGADVLALPVSDLDTAVIGTQSTSPWSPWAIPRIALCAVPCA